MREADGVVIFKEWLPDLPALDNPGLTEALNVLPVDGAYTSFATLSNGANAVPARPLGVIYTGPSGGGSAHTYVGTATQIYYKAALGGFTLASAATYNSSSGWDFERFDDFAIAVSGANAPQYITIGSANFATIPSVATSSAVGVVGQFLVLGDVGDEEDKLQWSSIGNPIDFPTPGSATAVARQAGAQNLGAFGTVNAIANGDQYGIALQPRAVTRMTYVGGDTVFQFDRIAEGVGCEYPHSMVQVEGVTYFADSNGIYATDGVSVRDITYGKVKRYWRNTINTVGNSTYFFNGAVDTAKKVIFWGFPSNAQSSHTQNSMLAFNYVEQRFTAINQQHEALFQQLGSVAAFRVGFTLGAFTDAPGTAVLTTGEVEFLRGGYSHVSGVKPLVDVTANAVTAALGTRNDQQASPTYTSEVTANSRSGFCDFRSEAKYHRARLTIAGTFNAAQGLEFQVEPSGPV